MIREHRGRDGRAARARGRDLAHQLSTALWPSANAPMYSTAAVASPRRSAGSCSRACSRSGVRLRAARARRARCSPGSRSRSAAAGQQRACRCTSRYQDRYLSLPLMGSRSASARVRRAPAIAEGRWPVALCGAIVAALGAALRAVPGRMGERTRLWGHAASTQPDAYYAFMKLGEVRRRAGDLYGAIRAYETAAADRPAAQGRPRRAAAERRAARRTAAPARAARAPTVRASSTTRRSTARRRCCALARAHAAPRPRARAGAAARARSSCEPLPDDALEHAAETHFKRRPREPRARSTCDACRSRTERAELQARRAAPSALCSSRAHRGCEGRRRARSSRASRTPARAASCSTSRAAAGPPVPQASARQVDPRRSRGRDRASSRAR